MEIRFDRDLRHNYMVLCGLPAGEDYRLKMLKENTPEGLLRCSLRSINGDNYLYYEIDSRQPLKNRFADGSMGAETLIRLLNSIAALSVSLEDYLLDMEHVLFSADCVYTDMRTGNFYFTYCPVPETLEMSGSFKDFSESLLELIDPDDEQAAVIAYGLCELSGNDGMLMTDIIPAALSAAKSAQGDDGHVADRTCSDPLKAQTVYREDGYIDTQSTERQSTASADIAESSGPSERDYAAVLAAMDEEEKPRVAKKKRGTLIMTLLFAAVFAANLYIRRSYYLDPREKLLSLAVAFLSLSMTVISLVLSLKASDKNRGEEDKATEGGPQETFIRPQLAEADLVGDFPCGKRAVTAGPDTIKSPSAALFSDGVSDGDEETTVLSALTAAGPNKLYGRNGDETVNISLEKLPLTVGKLSGAADFVIHDPSISRLHARFLGDGSGRATQIKDLNSTNGTWLNGRRLKPNETADIRSGDEIGLGKLVFELR